MKKWKVTRSIIGNVDVEEIWDDLMFKDNYILVTNDITKKRLYIPYYKIFSIEPIEGE